MGWVYSGGQGGAAGRAAGGVEGGAEGGVAGGAGGGAAKEAEKEAEKEATEAAKSAATAECPPELNPGSVALRRGARVLCAACARAGVSRFNVLVSTALYALASLLVACKDSTSFHKDVCSVPPSTGYRRPVKP